MPRARTSGLLSISLFRGFLQLRSRSFSNRNRLRKVSATACRELVGAKTELLAQKFVFCALPKEADCLRR